MKTIFGISLIAIFFAFCNASHNLKCEPVTGHHRDHPHTVRPLDHPTESPEISTETPSVDPSCWIDECDEREWTIEDSLKSVDECINIIMKLLEELIGELKFKKFREWWDNPFGGPLHGELFEGLNEQDETSKELLKKIRRTFVLMNEIVRLLNDTNLRDSYCTPCPPHKLNQSFFSEIYFKLNVMNSKLFSVPDHFHPDHPRVETPEISPETPSVDPVCLIDECEEQDFLIEGTLEVADECINIIMKLLEELLGEEKFKQFREWWDNPFGGHLHGELFEGLNEQDETSKELLQKIKRTLELRNEIVRLLTRTNLRDSSCTPCPPHKLNKSFLDEIYYKLDNMISELFPDTGHPVTAKRDESPESPCRDECYDRDESIKEKYEEIRECIEELWKLIKELLGDNLFGKFRDWWDQLRPPFGNEFEPDDPEFDIRYDILHKILDIIEKIIKCVREIENEKNNPFLLDVNCSPCPPYNSKDEPSEDENSHDIWFKYIIFRIDPFKIYIPTLPWPLPPLPLIYPMPWPFVVEN